MLRNKNKRIMALILSGVLLVGSVNPVTANASEISGKQNFRRKVSRMFLRKTQKKGQNRRRTWIWARTVRKNTLLRKAQPKKGQRRKAFGKYNAGACKRGGHRRRTYRRGEHNRRKQRQRRNDRRDGNGNRGRDRNGSRG